MSNPLRRLSAFDVFFIKAILLLLLGLERIELNLLFLIMYQIHIYVLDIKKMEDLVDGKK